MRKRVPAVREEAEEAGRDQESPGQESLASESSKEKQRRVQAIRSDETAHAQAQ